MFLVYLDILGMLQLNSGWKALFFNSDKRNGKFFRGENYLNVKYYFDLK